MFAIFEEIDGRSLTERVADSIEHMIIDGKFLLGDKLPNEFELASQLHVGRGTVREAIKTLVSRNVLRIARGSGTYVSECIGVMDDPLGFRFMPDKKKLALDLCEVRTMIEPRLAELAAENASAVDIEELQNLCDEVTVLIRSRKLYGRKDIEFHSKIAMCAGNRVVHALIPIINQGVEAFTFLTHSSSADTAPITHQQVVDAIRNRDPLAARRAMARHLSDNLQTIIALPDDLDFSSSAMR